MKKTLILISMISLFFSCKNEDADRKSIYFRFIVKNQTSKNVSLSFFYPNNQLYKAISILSKDSAVVDEGVVSPVGGTGFSLTNSLDSVIIRFNDEKKIHQTFFDRGNNDTINNLLSSSFYKSLSPNEPIKKRLFILTEADYLRAK